MTARDLDRLIGIGPHFSVHIAGDREVLLLSEKRSFRLTGRLYVALVPFLDGKRTGEEIVGAFAGRIAPDRLRKVLADLLAKNYACLLDSAAPAGRQALWAEFGLAPAEVERNLLGQEVAVRAATGHGPAVEAAGLLRQALQAFGVSLVPDEQARLVVVSVDDYLQPGLLNLSLDLRAAGQSWLPLKAGGGMPMLGPLFSPHAAPCWRCLAAAMTENRPCDTGVGSAAPARPARAFTSATLGLAAAFTALEIARLFAQPMPSSLQHSLLAFDLETRLVREHHVRAQPDCPVCGPAVDPVAILERAKAPLRLLSRRVSRQVDGGWRSLTADQVVQRLDRYVSPITGLISGLEDCSPGEGLPVFRARQAGPLTANVGANRLVGRPGGAAGKGMSESQARASCLAEAVERYLGHYRGNEPRLRATWDAVRDAAPHPHELLNFSDRQYAARETWNRSCTRFNRIGERFDETRATDWTPAWSVSHDRLRWLPTRFCYYEYVDAEACGGTDNRFCDANSNGCASGSTIEEAILQGFLELVERDACALWWYNRLERPAFDLQALDNAFVRRVEAYCARQKRGLHVIDVTTDFGIPAAIAISFNRDDGAGIVLGLGAHLDVDVAISRAVAELNQMLGLEAGALPRRPPSAEAEESPLLKWTRTHTLQTEPYCRPAGLVSARRYAKPRLDDLKQAVEHCARIVADRGHEMIVLDCSRSEIDFAVARVTVPGMRHFWARLGDGRLYRTPVERGWLDRALREDELNPVPFVF
ncbi:TOMM precursor leader peptide-binding protein [soil metagenome]